MRNRVACSPFDSLCCALEYHGGMESSSDTGLGTVTELGLCVTAALEDSRLSLAACAPALSARIVQDLSECCFSFLKGALEVPRLYRRTNKVGAVHCGELGGRGEQEAEVREAEAHALSSEELGWWGAPSPGSLRVCVSQGGCVTSLP